MSGVPYIGSKISLISRSEIRYEGILAEVDPKEATIGLENVVMMGTEERESPQGFVPLNPTVYEFVLFRSTDIKDLQVCEVPQPQQQPIQPVQQAVPQHQHGYQQQPDPYYYQQQQQQQLQQPVQVESAAKLQFGSGRSPEIQASYMEKLTSPQPQQAPSSLKFGSGPSVAVSKPQQQPPAQPSLQPPKAPTENIVSLTPKTDAKAAAASAAKVMTYSTGTKQKEFVEDKGQFAAPSKGTYASIAGHGTAPSVSRVSLERPGKFKAPAQPAASFSGQFSMVQSTASAQSKLSEAQEEVLRQISGGRFYEKSNSFFDNISCEAKDGKDFSAARHERNLNMETFGVAAPPQSQNYRGGRGGGSYRGGRGGYRGDSTGAHRGGSGSYRGNSSYSGNGSYRGSNRGRGGYNNSTQSRRSEAAAP